MNTFATKPRIHEAIHHLNQGFEQVLLNIARLERIGFQREIFKMLRVVVEDTRAWANFEVTEVMHDREMSDWARFGRLRRPGGKEV